MAYIDMIDKFRDELMDKFLRLCNYNDFNKLNLEKIADTINEVYDKCVVDTPTADVVEVTHGEWKLKSQIHRFMEEIDQDFYVECPFCHRTYRVPFEFEDEKMLEYARKNYPYCNCGAKMDGERK